MARIKDKSGRCQQCMVSQRFLTNRIQAISYVITDNNFRKKILVAPAEHPIDIVIIMLYKILIRSTEDPPYSLRLILRCSALWQARS